MKKPRPRDIEENKPMRKSIIDKAISHKMNKAANARRKQSRLDKAK